MYSTDLQNLPEPNAGLCVARGYIWRLGDWLAYQGIVITYLHTYQASMRLHCEFFLC